MIYCKLIYINFADCLGDHYRNISLNFAIDLNQLFNYIIETNIKKYIEMQVTISERPTEVKGLKYTTPKPQSSAISTTFSGCYTMEKIGLKQFCFVFDRGIEF